MLYLYLQLIIFTENYIYIFFLKKIIFNLIIFNYFNYI